jgi:hypothetical protein
VNDPSSEKKFKGTLGVGFRAFKYHVKTVPVVSLKVMRKVENMQHGAWKQTSGSVNRDKYAMAPVPVTDLGGYVGCN